jgi:hypothetical protein
VGEKPGALRRRFERADGLAAVRSDVQKAKALAWLIEHAEIVDEEGRPVDRADLEPPAEPDTETTDGATGEAGTDENDRVATSEEQTA